MQLTVACMHMFTQVGVPLLYLEIVLRRNRNQLHIVHRVQKTLDAKHGPMRSGALSDERLTTAAASGVVSRTRVLAHQIFGQTHGHLGIELDPASEFPVIRAIWPVYLLHHDTAGVAVLSPAEEELAFANYLRARRTQLDRKSVV